jgi:hypothetical protein
MTGLLPVTSNIFFDNFCANFFGSGLSTSNPVRNPILSLPNNVTVSLIGGHTDGNPVMDSNPQRIRMDFSVLGNYSNNSHDFLMYTFDYPIDLSVILDNLSTSRFFSMFASYNIQGGSIITPISVGIRFIDIFGTQLIVNSSSKTFFASSTLFEDLDIISSQPPTFDSTRVKKVVVFLSIVIVNLSPPSSLEFYSLGIRRYPVVGESITGTPTCFLYDNFMNSQKISGDPTSDQPTLTTTGDFFNYTTTSSNRIRTLESSGSSGSTCTINIFENTTNVSAGSPAAAHIKLSAPAPQSPQSSSSVKGTIKYGDSSSPIQISSECVGVMAYRINSTIPNNATLTVEVLDETDSLETREYTNTTLNDVHDIEYLTFDVLSTGNKTLSFEFTNTNNGSSAATIEVYVLYIMLWEKPSISLTPTLPNFFLDKTYHNLLTGSQPAENPEGVFPKNVTKTYFSSGLFTTTEDQKSTLITFSGSSFSYTNFIKYAFNPSADFTAIQNFIILATSDASNTSFSFRILIAAVPTSNIYYTSNAITLNNHTSSMSVVRVDDLNTNSNNPITILSNVSTILISLSTQGSSPPKNSTLRLYAIVCEYDCNIFPLYDNFILRQIHNDPPIVTPSDRSFNFPGHPIRELPTPSSSNSNINVFSHINLNFNLLFSGAPIAKCFRITVSSKPPFNPQSGTCTFPLRYRNINLNKDLKYFLTLTYFLPSAIPSGTTINSFTLNIKDVKTGSTLQTETLGTSLTHTSSLQKDINFIIDPPFEEDMELEFVVDYSNLSGNVAIFIDIPYIILQAETTTCVLEGTRITMADGSLKKIEDIKRGDLVLTVDGPLPVCRVIKETLSGLISLCKVPKGSISENIPHNDLYVCSRHVIRYNGKRRLATTLKAFKGVEILSGKRNQITNKLYMYDLQFEIETFYYAEGLESQSRSPYCHLSPLPKELYFNKELYKDIKVPDCLMYETEGFNNNWPNVYNRFSWRTYLAKYILNHPEIEFKPEDFNEQKALELKDKEHIDLTEIIPDDFDWEEYVRAHKDLKHFKNEMEACVHWVKYGYRENRYYKKYPFV